MDDIQKSNESWIKKHMTLTIIGIIVAIAIVTGFLFFKVSSPSGTVKEPLADVSDYKTTNCPSLSNFVFEGFVDDINSYVLDRADYKTTTEELVFVEPPSDKEDGTKIFFCDLGSKHIELGEDASKFNPSYVYCGDFIRPIVLYKLDSNGNKIISEKTSIEIIFDSKTKNYVETKCGTYDTVNAP